MFEVHIVNRKATLLVAILIFLEVAAFTDCEEALQRLSFFSDLNCKVNELRVDKKVPDLKVLKYRVRSLKYTGKWLLYGGLNYSKITNTGTYFQEYFDTSAKCERLKPMTSSIRYVGMRTNFSASALSLYEFVDYQGKEEVVLNDTKIHSNLKTINSLIISGCNAWNIFGKKNFSGSKVCVEPEYPCNGKPTTKPTMKSKNLLVGSMQKIALGKNCGQKKN